MTRKEFIEQYGHIKQEVNETFTSKSLGSEYSISDAFTEFCDNAWDARIDGQELKISFIEDENNHTLTIEDNGNGISNFENLFTLGGTDKEFDSTKIGKYGIGVPGATAAISEKCKFNKNDIVQIKIESYCGGDFSTNKTVMYDTNGALVVGETVSTKINNINNFTYTKIVFTNVKITNCADIIDTLEEKFEDPIHRNVNGMIIKYNGRKLGENKTPTFDPNSTMELIEVGPYTIGLRSYTSTSMAREERSFEESGLRVYDSSGRLLAKSTDLWKWFSSRTAQQNICGLRTAIYIQNDAECYKLFGVSSLKNKINYAYYYNKPEFQNLAKRLLEIYSGACKTAGVAEETLNEFKVNGIDFITSKKIKDPYTISIEQENTVLIKPLSKWSITDVSNLIAENIKLQQEMNKLKNKKRNNKNSNE